MVICFHSNQQHGKHKTVYTNCCIFWHANCVVIYNNCGRSFMCNVSSNILLESHKFKQYGVLMNLSSLQSKKSSITIYFRRKNTIPLFIMSPETNGPPPCFLRKIVPISCRDMVSKMKLIGFYQSLMYMSLVIYILRFSFCLGL